jgi:hypothetical protein
MRDALGRINDGDGKLGSVGVITGLYGAVDESEEFVETADPFRFKVKNLSRRSSPLAMMLGYARAWY